MENSQSLRVLVVEDEPQALDSLAQLLGGWGHAPVAAPDGEAALRALERECPDVVLLDIGLPDMDGLEVARRIRQRWPYKPPVLIAVTGLGTTEDRRASNEAGVDLHLLKPVDAAELECLLGQCRPTDSNAHS
jgi:CheY-like chemotaxis protein